MEINQFTELEIVKPENALDHNVGRGPNQESLRMGKIGKTIRKRKGAFLPPNSLANLLHFRSVTSEDYFPLALVIILAKASPFLSMAYSTVSFAPVEDVLRSVS